MNPEIISSAPILLAGLSFYGDPFQEAGGWSEENAIGQLWQRFTRLYEKYPEIINRLNTTSFNYEIHLETLETPQTGAYEVFVGFVVDAVTPEIAELSFKQLPEVDYAVFTLQGEAIRGNWSEEIFESWLKNSAYQSAASYLIERYDERFKGMDQIKESVMEVLVPVKKRGV